MSDTPPSTAAPVGAPAKTDPNAQMIVALRIVYIMGAIGVALIAAGVITSLTGHGENAIWLGIGTIVGSLGTALNAPNGTAGAITAAKKADGQ